MKITQAPDGHKLRVSHWGRFIAYCCLGLGTWAIFGTVLYRSSHSATLTCQRVEPAQVDCEWLADESGTPKQPAQTIRQLREITLVTPTSSEDTLHQAVLLSQDGRSHTINLPSPDLETAQQKINQVHQFLADGTQARLMISFHSLKPVAVAVVLAIALFAGGLIILAVWLSPIWIEIQTSPDQQSVHLKRRYPLKISHQVLASEAIAAVIVDPPDEKEDMLCQIKLMLTSGEAVELKFWGNSHRDVSTLACAIQNLISPSKN
ncbi:MAG: hypothetical protein VKK04_04805 [Synechococcales bacterium]|nr:hypothetical protein [Synechococcales bacterium]